MFAVPTARSSSSSPPAGITHSLMIKINRGVICRINPLTNPELKGAVEEAGQHSSETLGDEQKWTAKVTQRPRGGTFGCWMRSSGGSQLKWAPKTQLVAGGTGQGVGWRVRGGHILGSSMEEPLLAEGMHKAGLEGWGCFTAPFSLPL